MKKSYFIMTAAFLLTLGMWLGGNLHQSSAQSAGFSQVEVFSGGGGVIKFFDKSNGKIYSYNHDLTKLIDIVQLKELGKPAQVAE